MGLPVASWSGTDSMVLLILANVLASQNREAKAAGLLEYVLKREPGNGEAVRALCGVYLMLGRYNDALEMVERHEKRNPSDGSDPVMMIKGQALYELGLTEKAAQVVNLFLARNVAT
jgi:predicted Zn-dependent protease